MRHECRIRFWSASLMPAIALLFLTTQRGVSQEVGEYQVKAAYLYNFAKFVEWPAQSFAGAGDPFRFCISSNSLFKSELTQTLQGKTIGGRQISVVPVQRGDRLSRCHLVFIGESQARMLREMLDDVQGSSVLTIGEADEFLKEGGMINFVLLGNRVRFQVNHKAANEAGLRISSRLLSLATLVVE